MNCLKQKNESIGWLTFTPQQWVSFTFHLTPFIRKGGVNGPEIGNFGAQKTYKEPINDGYEISLRCLKIMAKIGQNKPKIRALGVSCSGLLKDQYLPLFREQKIRQNLIKAIDRINTRHGEDTIFPAIITLTRRMQ